MSRQRRMLVLLSFDTAALAAIILGVVSRFTTIPSETIPVLNITLSRWWDILFAVIYVNLIALPFLYRQEIARIFSIDADDVEFGFLGGLGVGLPLGLAAVPGFGVGVVRMVGFLVGLGVGFALGRAALPGFGLGVIVGAGFLGGLVVGLGFGLGLGLEVGVVFEVGVVVAVVLHRLFRKHIKIADTTK